MKTINYFFYFFFLLSGLPSYAQKYGWAKQFLPPASAAVQGNAIILDDDGNVYIGGSFSNTVDFDPGPNTFSLTASGSKDPFIVKLDPLGNFIWAVHFGSNQSTTLLNNLTVDHNGNVYSVGYYNHTADFDPGPNTANLTSVFTTDDIFISKLDAGGNYIWARTVGSDAIDDANGVAVDDAGNVYITGHHSGTIDVDPGPGTVYFGNSFGDVFILKLDPAGLYMNSISVSSPGLDHSDKVIVKNGFLYCSTWFNTEARIGKYDLDLNLVWERETQGTGNCWPTGLTIDDAGNAIFTGKLSDLVDFDPGPGIANKQSVGGFDAFICKWDGNGNFCWARSMGSTGVEEGNGIASDANGDIYLTGQFDGNFYFDGTNVDSYLVPQNTDMFIEKVNAMGAFQWVEKMNGASSELSYAIAVDGSSNVFTTGYFGGTVDFDPDPTATHTLSAPASSQSGFVSKLAALNHISGNVFKDSNLDGIRQQGEHGFRYIVTKADGQELRYGLTDTTGGYDIYVDTGSYTITLPHYPLYHTSSVISQNAIFGGNIGQADSLNDFPVYPIPGINDLSVHVYTLNTPRPGVLLYMTVIYMNNGTTALSGNVTLQHAAQLIYQGAYPVEDSYTNPLLTWNFSNLQPDERREIHLFLSVPSTVPLGTLFQDIATVNPVINDTTPGNNVYALSQVVTGSFDPNNKSVNPSGPITTTYIAADSTSLDYCIRFQNTGTDTAFLVVVDDTLQNTLDISSLKIISASHPFEAKFVGENILRFTFKNINLPDSNTNEPLSHGYIAFTLKPFGNLPVGTEVTNKAAIYFDFNEEVETNETDNLVVSIIPVALSEFDVHNNDCRSVVLNWTTENEQSNSSFAIERSTDATHWFTIAGIRGAGTTGAPTHYTYTDLSTINGTVYYRLKQTNSNNISTWSFIQKLSCDDKVGSVKVYPNPVAGNLFIDAGTSFGYELFNECGALIKKGYSASPLLKLYVSDLPKGIYMLRLNMGNGMSQHKILID